MHSDTARVELRAEMQQLEAQLAARLEEQEKNVAERLQAARVALNRLRTEFATQEQLAAVQQGVEAVATRLTALEHSNDAISQYTTALAAELTEDIHKLEKDVAAQAVSIESVRTAMVQTDDLVERAVEALEMIQESVLDAANGRS